VATKSITIDLEAYERLSQAKQTNESFSQTIKRVVRPPFDFDAWLKRLRRARLSPQATAAVERQIADRRKRSRRTG
jgi:hypothetical protein